MENKNIYDNYITERLSDFNSGSKKEYEEYKRYFNKNYEKYLNKKDNILDLGCGMGHFLFFLKSEGYNHYLGVDIGKEQIEFCKKNGFNVKKDNIINFIKKTKKNSYDVIILNDVIEHIPKKEIIPFLEEIYRVLKKDGRFIVKTVNLANPFLGAYSRYIDFTHELGFTPESIKQVYNLSGFKKVEVKELNIYCTKNILLNLIGKISSIIINLILKIIFYLYGRKNVKVLSKNLLAIGYKNEA